MLGKFGYQFGKFGFKFCDAVGVGLLWNRLGHIGDGKKILVRHVGITKNLAAVFADKFEAVVASRPGFAL